MPKPIDPSDQPQFCENLEEWPLSAGEDLSLPEADQSFETAPASGYALQNQPTQPHNNPVALGAKLFQNLQNAAEKNELIELNVSQELAVASFLAEQARAHFKNLDAPVEAQTRLHDLQGQIDAAAGGDPIDPLPLMIEAETLFLQSRQLAQVGAFRFHVPSQTSPHPVEVSVAGQDAALQKILHSVEHGENDPSITTDLQALAVYEAHLANKTRAAEILRELSFTGVKYGDLPLTLDLPKTTNTHSENDAVPHEFLENSIFFEVFRETEKKSPEEAQAFRHAFASLFVVAGNADGAEGWQERLVAQVNTQSKNLAPMEAFIKNGIARVNDEIQKQQEIARAEAEKYPEAPAQSARLESILKERVSLESDLRAAEGILATGDEARSAQALEDLAGGLIARLDAVEAAFQAHARTRYGISEAHLYNMLGGDNPVDAVAKIWITVEGEAKQAITEIAQLKKQLADMRDSITKDHPSEAREHLQDLLNRTSEKLRAHHSQLAKMEAATLFGDPLLGPKTFKGPQIGGPTTFDPYKLNEYAPDTVLPELPDSVKTALATLGRTPDAGDEKAASAWNTLVTHLRESERQAAKEQIEYEYGSEIQMALMPYEQFETLRGESEEVQRHLSLSETQIENRAKLERALDFLEDGKYLEAQTLFLTVVGSPSHHKMAKMVDEGSSRAKGENLSNTIKLTAVSFGIGNVVAAPFRAAALTRAAGLSRTLWAASAEVAQGVSFYSSQQLLGGTWDQGNFWDHLKGMAQYTVMVGALKFSVSRYDAFVASRVSSRVGQTGVAVQKDALIGAWLNQAPVWQKILYHGGKIGAELVGLTGENLAFHTLEHGGLDLKNFASEHLTGEGFLQSLTALSGIKLGGIISKPLIKPTMTLSAKSVLNAEQYAAYEQINKSGEELNAAFQDHYARVMAGEKISTPDTLHLLKTYRDYVHERVELEKKLPGYVVDEAAVQAHTEAVAEADAQFAAARDFADIELTPMAENVFGVDDATLSKLTQIGQLKPVGNGTFRFETEAGPILIVYQGKRVTESPEALASKAHTDPAALQDLHLLVQRGDKMASEMLKKMDVGHYGEEVIQNDAAQKALHVLASYGNADAFLILVKAGVAEAQLLDLSRFSAEVLHQAESSNKVWWNAYVKNAPSPKPGAVQKTIHDFTAGAQTWVQSVIDFFTPPPPLGSIAGEAAVSGAAKTTQSPEAHPAPEMNEPLQTTGSVTGENADAFLELITRYDPYHSDAIADALFEASADFTETETVPLFLEAIRRANEGDPAAFSDTMYMIARNASTMSLSDPGLAQKLASLIADTRFDPDARQNFMEWIGIAFSSDARCREAIGKDWTGREETLLELFPEAKERLRLAEILSGDVQQSILEGTLESLQGRPFDDTIDDTLTSVYSKLGNKGKKMVRGFYVESISSSDAKTVRMAQKTILKQIVPHMNPEEAKDLFDDIARRVPLNPSNFANNFLLLEKIFRQIPLSAHFDRLGGLDFGDAADRMFAYILNSGAPDFARFTSWEPFVPKPGDENRTDLEKTRWLVERLITELAPPGSLTEIDTGRYVFEMSPVFTSGKRLYAYALVSDRLNPGEKKARLFYFSQSQGAWRASPLVLNGAFFKGESYTSTTLLTEPLLNYFHGREAAKTDDFFTERLTRLFDIPQKFKGDEHSRFLGKEYSKFLEDDYRASFEPSVASELVELAKQKVGQVFDSDINETLFSSDELTGLKYPIGFVPDFKQSPAVREFTHNLLGPCVERTYVGGTLGGESVIWKINVDSKGRIWVDVRYTNETINSFGSNNQYIDAGVLQAKPLDYGTQTNRLGNYNRIPVDDHYYDISHIIALLAPIQSFIRDSGYIPPGPHLNTAESAWSAENRQFELPDGRVFNTEIALKTHSNPKANPMRPDSFTITQKGDRTVYSLTYPGGYSLEIEALPSGSPLTVRAESEHFRYEESQLGGLAGFERAVDRFAFSVKRSYGLLSKMNTQEWKAQNNKDSARAFDIIFNERPRYRESPDMPPAPSAPDMKHPAKTSVKGSTGGGLLMVAPISVLFGMEKFINRAVEGIKNLFRNSRSPETPTEGQNENSVHLGRFAQEITQELHAAGVYDPTTHATFMHDLTHRITTHPLETYLITVHLIRLLKPHKNDLGLMVDMLAAMSFPANTQHTLTVYVNATYLLMKKGLPAREAMIWMKRTADRVGPLLQAALVSLTPLAQDLRFTSKEHLLAELNAGIDQFLKSQGIDSEGVALKSLDEPPDLGRKDDHADANQVHAITPAAELTPQLPQTRRNRRPTPQNIPAVPSSETPTSEQTALPDKADTSTTLQDKIDALRGIQRPAAPEIRKLGEDAERPTTLGKGAPRPQPAPLSHDRITFVSEAIKLGIVDLLKDYDMNTHEMAVLARELKITSSKPDRAQEQMDEHVEMHRVLSTALKEWKSSAPEEKARLLRGLVLSVDSNDIRSAVAHFNVSGNPVDQYAHQILKKAYNRDTMASEAEFNALVYALIRTRLVHSPLMNEINQTDPSSPPD